MKHIYISFKSLWTMQKCWCNPDHTKAIMTQEFFWRLKFGISPAWYVRISIFDGCFKFCNLDIFFTCTECASDEDSCGMSRVQSPNSMKRYFRISVIFERINKSEISIALEKVMSHLTKKAATWYTQSNQTNSNSKIQSQRHKNQ